MGGSEKALYAKQYYSGNYEVVEGAVYKLETEDVHSYYVDDVYFIVPMGHVSYSDIKENGQQVRISYIPHEEKMEDGTIIKECSQILKFEMVKDDTTKDEKITLKEN